MGAGINETRQLLGADEINTLGEVLNIGMGAAATTVSVLLNKRVSITTPVVKVTKKEKFKYPQLEPAIGVEINYTGDLHEMNLMIMNVSDVRKLTSCLLGESGTSADEETDNLHQNAFGELMNQMMGSSSNALAAFLDRSINITPPKISESGEFCKRLYDSEISGSIVTVEFKLFVDELVDNSFITVLPIELAKELARSAMRRNPKSDAGEESAETIKPGIEYKQQRRREQMSPKQNEQKNINIKNIKFDNFDEVEEDSGISGLLNLDLVMDVELNITVEIGHAKKPVKDVLNITKGSIIELDKQAGEPVDVVVNGQLIAKGDVVVIDDNFGVRITKVFGSK